MALPAAAQTLTVEQTPWEPQPIFRRWIKTVTITFVPAATTATGDPDDEGIPVALPANAPLGYIERLYCTMNPSHSPRCPNADGPGWTLTAALASGGMLYGVRNSTGR